MRLRRTAVSIAIVFGFGTATCADDAPTMSRYPHGPTVAIPGVDPTTDTDDDSTTDTDDGSSTDSATESTADSGIDSSSVSTTRAPSTTPTTSSRPAVSTTTAPPESATDDTSTSGETSDDATTDDTTPDNSPDRSVPGAPLSSNPGASGTRPGSRSTSPSSSDDSDGPKSAAGPYNVGVMTTTLSDDARPLTVEIWFPLSDLVDVNDLPPRRYSLLDNAYYDSPNAYSAFSKFIATDQKFPLVVYSHGSGGMRYVDSEFVEALASHGYVVAATDHVGDTATDMLAGVDDPISEIMFNRPRDVGRVIDALTGAPDVVSSDKIGPIVEMVDTDQIAVSGHSVGGATAIATVTGLDNDAGTNEPDDRVGAIVVLAPAVDEIVTDDQLADLEVPMMIVAGSDDQTTPVADNVDPLWAATDNTPAYEIELIGAEHNSFTDVCAYQESFVDKPDVPKLIVSTVDRYAHEGCGDDDMDIDRVHDLTEMYVVGFLDEVFRDVPPIAADSAPDDVVIEVRR